MIEASCMRQIHDMKTSLFASIALHAGALAAAFGVGMFFSSGKHAVWLTVAALGILGIVMGALQRRPAQRAAYKLYLAQQDVRDLQEANPQHLDEESLSLIKLELKARKTKSAS